MPATNLTPQPLHPHPMSPQYSAPTTTIPPIPIPQPPEQHLMTHHQFDDLPSHTPTRNSPPTPVIPQPLHLGSEEFTTTPQPRGADFIPMNPDMHMDAPTGWPLRIPTSLESTIQHTIMDWLSSNSIQIVKSTVHGEVDACIPHLEELIDTKIASLSSKQTSKGSRPCSCIPLGSGDDGWEGDAELDEDKPLVSSPKGRKKAVPRGHMNHLHVWPLPDTCQLMLIVLQSAFRKYLTEKGVIATKDQIPVQAPLTQVQAFNRDGNSPPTIDNISIDWNCYSMDGPLSFSSTCDPPAYSSLRPPPCMQPLD